MKKFTLILISLFIFQVSRAQVTDTHPAAQIYAINYQSGQEEPATSDQAILFKDAFINLAGHTDQGRLILHMNRGKKIAVIKQVDPQKFNGYQLTWRNQEMQVLCTFYYHIDQNALFFYDTGVRDWVNVAIQGDNMNNLDACRQYAGFNSRQGTPDLSANSEQQQVPDLSVNDNADQDNATTEMQAGLDTLSDEEISAAVAPPALPDYDQPPCPVEGYLWQPGYWAWSRPARDYYWVPGVWVAPPRPGLLWTPCYWGFAGGVYVYHPGYWGVSVGFYGGIHYGFGYMGVGFVGGEWHGGVFRYNTAVVHVNTTVVHNTYINRTVINNTTIVNRSSFNGQGGVTARPNSQEQAAVHEQHFRPTNDQLAHQQESRNNQNQFVSANHGRPAVTSMAKVNPAPANFRSNTGNRASGTPGNGNRSFNNKPVPGATPRGASPANGARNLNTKPANDGNLDNGRQRQQGNQFRQPRQRQPHQGGQPRQNRKPKGK